MIRVKAFRLTCGCGKISPEFVLDQYISPWELKTGDFDSAGWEYTGSEYDVSVQCPDCIAAYQEYSAKRELELERERIYRQSPEYKAEQELKRLEEEHKRKQQAEEFAAHQALLQQHVANGGLLTWTSIGLTPAPSIIDPTL